MTGGSSLDAVELVYDVGPDGSVVARFGEREVSVKRGRVRHYPGLVDFAPDTSALYAFAGRLLPDVRHGLDLGCGSGHGTSILNGTWADVTGTDTDTEAVEFCRLAVPGARFVGDLDERGEDERYDGAVVIDVLGMVEEPYLLLRRLWRAVEEDSLVVVAEPRAHSSQLLHSPARRAFSSHDLASVLESAGFEVLRTATDTPTFVVNLVRRAQPPGATELEQGLLALDRNDVDRASSYLAVCANSVSPAIRLAAELARAEMCLAARSADMAIQCLLRATQANPQDPRPPARLARVFALAGERDEARRLAGGALSLDPLCTEAQVLMAQLVYDRGPDLAKTCWASAAALSPSDPWIVVEHARLALEAGQPEDAVRAVEGLQAYNDPMDPEHHAALAEVLHAAGRTTDARFESRLASIQQVPGSPTGCGCDRLAPTLPPPHQVCIG